MPIISILLLPIGFVLLIKGADFLVDGSSSVARRLHIPDLIIGLTIVAFGTSAPELFVCIISSIKGNGGITVGNIIGSNIANICLILGISGILSPLAFQKSTILRDIPFLLLSTFLLLFAMLTNNLPNMISQLEASTLLAVMIIYLFCMFKTSGKGIIEAELQSIEKIHTAKRSILMILGGLTGLITGGQLIVDSSITIATALGISEELIGLSIIALGTSLPELATSIVAVRKNKTDIAVGNVIGSNLFNIAMVLGVSGLISPINTVQSLNNDMLILTFVTLLLVVFMFTGKRNKIDRWEAVILTLMYVLYMSYIIQRG